MDKRLAAGLWLAAAFAFAVWSVSASAQQVFVPGRIDSQHVGHTKMCSDCHEALKGLPDAKCIKCHKKIAREQKAGITIHAKTDAACPACHELHGRSLGDNLLSPAGKFHAAEGFFVGEHAGAACRACHKQKELKKISVACESCHLRETRAHEGNISADCSNCHKPGRFWRRLKVVHETGADCAGCHRAPENHYWPDCAQCHNVDTWQGATFNHPPVRGHDFREFECAACHPNGYSSWSCDRCHNGSRRGDDEGRERW